MPVTNYLWDPETDAYLMETDGDGNTTAVSQRRGGQDSYYQQDALGSTRQLTDAGEAVTDEYTYSAYGETVASSGSTVNPFRWIGGVGYYHDAETEDYYVRARYYSPVPNRWSSTDPHRFTDGTNLFRAYFVPQDYDPTGLDRTVYNCGHAWIEVDEWEASGKKTGKRIVLDFAPSGIEQMCFCSAPPGENYLVSSLPSYPQICGLSIPSDAEADRKLVQFWRFLEKERKEGRAPDWDPVVNCWVMSYGLCLHGIPFEPPPTAPIVAPVSPSPPPGVNVIPIGSDPCKLGPPTRPRVFE